jgi:hypothetical protein
MTDRLTSVIISNNPPTEDALVGGSFKAQIIYISLSKLDDCVGHRDWVGLEYEEVFINYFYIFDL